VLLTVETHPFNRSEPIPEGTCLLIVGTVPPPRFANRTYGVLRDYDFEFFYGSQDNYMWEFLDQIAEHIDGQNLFEENTPRDQCRDIARKFLRRHKIWMHDVLETYQRKKGREDKAGDDDIRPPPDAKFTAFSKVFEAKSISKLAFTSERAAEWTISALKEQSFLSAPESYERAFLQWTAIDKSLPIQQYVQRKFKQPFVRGHIANRDIDFFILPSPSGNARSGKYGLTLGRRQDIYEFVLFRS
jgi:G:T/U-mismatch repair DNA glycosylase